MSQTVDVSNASIPLIDYVPRFYMPGRPSPLNLDREYDTSVVINIGIPMYKFLFSLYQPQFFIQRKLQSSMNLSEFRSTWYSNCFHSVFQPSDFVMRFLSPYVKFFDSHNMIGVHIRMRGNYSEWTDRPFYMTMDNVTAQFENLDNLLKADSKSVIYLATDSKYIERIIVQRFRKRVITAGKLPVMHTGKYTNEAGALRVYMDLYLLSRCKTLFLTSKCIYSKLAYLINPNDPLVFYFYNCLSYHFYCEVHMTSTELFSTRYAIIGFLCTMAVSLVIQRLFPLSMRIELLP